MSCRQLRAVFDVWCSQKWMAWMFAGCNDLFDPYQNRPVLAETRSSSTKDSRLTIHQQPLSFSLAWATCTLNHQALARLSLRMQSKYKWIVASVGALWRFLSGTRGWAHAAKWSPHTLLELECNVDRDNAVVTTQKHQQARSEITPNQEGSLSKSKG